MCQLLKELIVILCIAIDKAVPCRAVFNRELVYLQQLNANTVLMCKSCQFHLLATIRLSSPLPDTETGFTLLYFLKAFLPQFVVGANGVKFPPLTILFDGSKKLILKRLLGCFVCKCLEVFVALQHIENAGLHNICNLVVGI